MCSKLKTSHGIVTRGMELGNGTSFICVWAPCSPLKEYKFPRWSGLYPEWFKPGDLVEFEAMHDVNEPQKDENIRKMKDPEKLRKFTIVQRNDREPRFLLYVRIFFPPIDIDYYKTELDGAMFNGCRALGWCWEFGKVALMDSELTFEPGLCYSGFVTRIKPAIDWIAEKMGTFWVICANEPFEEITDPKAVEELRHQIPWKDRLVTNMVVEASSSFGTGNNLIPATTFSNNLSMTYNQRPLSPIANNRGDGGRNTFTFSRQNTALLDNNNFGLQQEHDDTLAIQPWNLMGQMVSNDAAESASPDTDIVEGCGKEYVLFGGMIAHKMDWIGARDSEAVHYLQKAILDLCQDCKSKLLQQQIENNNNHHTLVKCNQQQPKQPATSGNNNSNSLAINLFG